MNNETTDFVDITFLEMEEQTIPPLTPDPSLPAPPPPSPILSSSDIYVKNKTWCWFCFWN